MELKIVSLIKEVDKKKGLNLRFSKGYDTPEEIIIVQCPPLIKTSLGYIGESSKTIKSSKMGTRRYINVVKGRSWQHFSS